MDSTPLRDQFRKRLVAFSRELKGIETGNVQALHRGRVASRRLRELLPILELDRDITRLLMRRLRTVTKQLGAVRDRDVLILLIRELSRKRRYPAAPLTQMAATIAPARVAARERLGADLPIAKLRRLVRKLERAAKVSDAGGATSRSSNTIHRRHAWLWAVEARLARRATAVRDAIDAAGAMYVPEPLHRVRIAAKKLRYAAELAAATSRRRFAADVAALKVAQDLLGRLHDFEVLLGCAREAQASLSPPDLTAWRDLALLIHMVDNDCRQLHARYMRNRGQLMAIANRMGARQDEPQLLVQTSAV